MVFEAPYDLAACYLHDFTPYPSPLGSLLQPHRITSYFTSLSTTLLPQNLCSHWDALPPHTYKSFLTSYNSLFIFHLTRWVLPDHSQYKIAQSLTSDTLCPLTLLLSVSDYDYTLLHFSPKLFPRI